jgi:hypothetical protein
VFATLGFFFRPLHSMAALGENVKRTESSTTKGGDLVSICSIAGDTRKHVVICLGLPGRFLFSADVCTSAGGCDACICSKAVQLHCLSRIGARWQWPLSEASTHRMDEGHANEEDHRPQAAGHALRAVCA